MAKIKPAKLVAATKYVLEMGKNKEYTKKGMKELHPRTLVPEALVKTTNDLYKTGGNWYEVKGKKSKK